MCRIAGYLGEPLPLSALLTSPPHSLRNQAKMPRELPAGAIGSDGFGVGWFAAEQTSPARYRSLLPIWVDENLDTFADHVSSPAIVASSRTASRRMPIAITNTPPFAADASLLVHNGEVTQFQSLALEVMRSQVSEQARAEILGNTDTEYLAALLRDRSETALIDRVRGTLSMVRRCVETAGTTAQLNLIVLTGHEIVVARHAIGKNAPSLYVRQTPSGLFAASEAMDDAAGWQTLEPGDLVVAARSQNATTVQWSRLEA